MSANLPKPTRPAPPMPACKPPKSDCANLQAELYAVLREMHWFDMKLCVIDTKDLPLGVQTYSGDMLDEAIRRYMKHDGAAPASSPSRLKLKRGTTGTCDRSVCICERDGLGDECVWLRPAGEKGGAA